MGTKAETRNRRNPGHPGRLIVAALIPFAAFGLQWFFWAAIQPYVWLLFYPAVFFSSWVGGLRGGLLATGLSAGLVWYFFIPPQLSFALQRPMSFISIAVFAGMGVLFSLFHGRLRKAHQQVAEALAAVGSANNELEDEVLKRTTDLQQANTALRESQAMLQTALSSMTDAVFISDAEGRFIEFNEAFATFHKFRNKEECAKTLAEYPMILDVLLPGGELLPLEQWAVPRALRGETVANAEYTLRRKDTGETWVGSYSFAPLRDGDGTIVGSVVTARDITERRRVEQDLRDRISLLKVAGRVARFGGWSVNLAEGRVLWSDEVAAIHETSLGFSPTLAEGINFYAPEWRERIATVFRACARDGKAYDEEMQIITAHGRRVWVRAIGEAERNPAGAIVAVHGAFQDITERRQADEEIRKLNAELEQRVRERTAQLEAANKELEAFAYAVSHDLRAPLRAMNGFSQALLEDFDPTLPAAAREYLGEIILGSRRMGDLIDGLLQLSRSTRGELRRDTVDLSVLATRILGKLAAAEPNRHVTWTVEPALTAHGDERMLEVVLVNLLGNAWKYTTHRADAKIDVGRQEVSGVRCQVSEESETRSLTLETFFVRDNGAGFDMRHAARLFHPFQRLHREDEFPGIGIGLATVQRIIHRHGGTIRAVATPGQGATFTFSLPDPNAHDEESP